MYRLCDLCGIREAARRFREVTGWEEIRDQGGANKIIARKETGRRACADCITRLRDGLSIAQERLL